jgi:parallel beta helix pectate lyase-like protein
MNRLFAVPLAIAVAMIAFCCSLTPASAQATRTWVSGVGDDVNPCSRTAPCKTFAGAISKTAQDGEINCLDPGGFGTVTITKSITIDCHEILGSILSSATNGINIAFDSFGGGDTHKTVNLRNLMINGAATGVVGINITGTTGAAGSIVNIEDCLINSNYGGVATGIVDGRSRGAMTVTNTTIRNMGTAGISITGGSGGSLRAMITNTRIYNSNNGITIGANANVMLSRSVVSDGTGTGLTVGASGLMAVDSTVIAHNLTGFGVNGTLRLSNSDVFLNSTGSTGTINTFANNRFSNNGAFGTITPIGSTSNPTGQQ